MKDNEHLEKLMDEILQDAPLEQPPHDFTHSVIKRIEEERVAALSYRPIMPKWAIVTIVIVLVILASWGIFGGDLASISEPRYAKLVSLMDSWFSESLPVVKFSNKTVYTVLVIAVMILIQTTALKRLFDRRFTSA
ncbi:hypothetical protein [Flagellimonas nanhaiensis]|uniref:Uncharacterized protein n=1 Tax=Flagellimonas nanhaiensis TaxID=2292706 RepID=A0A371JL27_9FLAO|nr:hypothetical protein [Allomuricauda nanhaiensis]RDY57667.1 hypothetical protein DX873_18285 [Allomuricauda nanhaiensis]